MERKIVKSLSTIPSLSSSVQTSYVGWVRSNATSAGCGHLICFGHKLEWARVRVGCSLCAK